MPYTHSTRPLQPGPTIFDRWFGFLFFGTMLVWAAISFQERVGYLDTGYYLYRILEEGSFYIAHNRKGALLTQILPLLLRNFQAPLKAVMISYSLNFILVYFTCYWFCMFRWKNRQVAYAICLFLVFSVGITFYWPVSEMFLSLVYAMTFYGFWTAPKPRNSWHTLVGGILLITLAINTYLGVVLPLGFLLTYDFLNRKIWRKPLKILHSGLAIIAILVIWQWKGQTNYEQHRTQALGGIFDMIPHLFEFYGARLVLELHIGTFLILLVRFSGIDGCPDSTEEVDEIAGFLSFLLHLFLPANRPIPPCEIALIMENLLLPFAFFQTLVICLEAFDQYRLVRVGIFVWIVLSFFRIVDSRQYLLDRGQYYEALSKNLDHLPGRKIVSSSANHGVHMDCMRMFWPTFG